MALLNGINLHGGGVKGVAGDGAEGMGAGAVEMGIGIVGVE